MFKPYLKAIENILFPSLCLSCQNRTDSQHLCPGCQKNITFLYPGCRGELISLTAYKEPMVSLIHYFKYKNCDYLAEFLGQLMNKQLKRIGFSASSYDFIAPVPLHKHKLKLRGYNQAELLARILSNYFKIPLRNDIIYELNAKPPQARLAQNLRQANAQGAFKSKENLNGSRIVLVDDILTTGATAGACCKTLKENGAAAITVITLSKTLQK